MQRKPVFVFLKMIYRYIFFHINFPLAVGIREDSDNFVFAVLLLVASCYCFIFLLQWKLSVTCHLLKMFFHIHKFFLYSSK